ncbi:MAG: hypothetical protein J1E58_06165, partial [Prevotella sp.]|nr:hypothetical protein [Prevotella sp.]
FPSIFLRPPYRGLKIEGEMNFCAQAREVPPTIAQTLSPSVEDASFRPCFPQTFALVSRKIFSPLGAKFCSISGEISLR